MKARHLLECLFVFEVSNCCVELRQAVIVQQIPCMEQRGADAEQCFDLRLVMLFNVLWRVLTIALTSTEYGTTSELSREVRRG